MSLAFVLAVVLYTQGSRGQYIVTQTPTETALPTGQTLSLSCKTSVNVDGDCGSSSNLQCQSWYRQKPGQEPKALTGSGNALLSGTPSRFSASGSGSDFTLTIRGVQAEDTGVYYCLSIHCSPCVWTFGGGTKLIIKTGVTVRPSISLLPPSSSELSGGQATLACLLSDYSPQGALVSWEVDGRAVTEGVLTGEEAEKSGKSARSSTLTLSKARWEEGDLYTCRVSHEGSSHSAEVRRTQCSV